MVKNGKMMIGVGIGLGMVVAGIYLATRKEFEIPLSAGWNEVIYTGKRQIAGVALSSIGDYLLIAYYYDTLQGFWVQIIYNTMLETGMVVNVNVSQNCVWRF